MKNYKFNEILFPDKNGDLAKAEPSQAIVNMVI